MRILHTMLRVGDLDRSIDFYTNVLGMRVLRRTDRPDQKYTLAFVGYGDEASGAEGEACRKLGLHPGQRANRRPHEPLQSVGLLSVLLEGLRCGRGCHSADNVHWGCLFSVSPQVAQGGNVSRHLSGSFQHVADCRRQRVASQPKRSSHHAPAFHHRPRRSRRG